MPVPRPRRPRPSRLLGAALLLVLALAVPRVRADEIEDHLQKLSSAELDDLEKKLRVEVSKHKQDLDAMRVETDRLKKEQKAVDDEAERLQGAKKWEMDEKERREKELDDAKKDVQEKQESISRMSVQVSGLKDQINVLQSRLNDLTREKDSTERRYNDPSIVDVLESRSQGWSNVSRNVYRKTIDEVVPVISEISETARSYRRRVSRTSKILELFASLLIYGFVVAASMVVYRVYSKVRGKLTIGRLLFLGDSFCAGFWVVMLVCFSVLLDDPLYVMKERSPTPFFVFQLVACITYVNFVLLRVLVLASKMTLGALGETLAVVVVGHHYYVRVWQPAILDKPFRGTFFYYFCYAWLFAAFAYNRIQEFAPLKQLRGPKLPPSVWLNVLIARFTRRNVPDGDIENTADADTDDDGHER